MVLNFSGLTVFLLCLIVLVINLLIYNIGEALHSGRSSVLKSAFEGITYIRKWGR